MSKDPPNSPRAVSTNGAHLTGASDIFDMMGMPAKVLADFMRSGSEIYRTNMLGMLTMVNPKLLEGTRGAHIYAIAKHYLPTKVFANLPAILTAAMGSWGITIENLQEMEEDDLTIFILEATGKWWAQFEEGKLHTKEYNKKFLAEDANGEIGAMDPDNIISLFHRVPGDAEPDEYPRIIFTASHANAEGIEDVTRITHGIEAMARDSWEGQKLNLAHRGEDIKPGQTLILFGNDTRSNAMLNGAALTRRVKELKAREADGQPDTFEHMAPGAKRLARLMLACMCENYYNDGRHLFDIDTREFKPLNEILPAGTHVELSKNARAIAQHFQLLGYSKGGNVVSDAMRFLQHDLMTLDAQGQGVVWMRNGDDQLHDIVLDKQFGVRSLLRNINTASIAARERPFSQEQKDSGLRRVAFNNINDLLTNNYFYKGSPNDEFYEIKGTEDKIGHDPKDCMGDRNDRGYALNDARVARRMKEFFAPHHGRAAIANLFIEDGTMKMESAPGTPDYTMMKNQDVFLKAMRDAGLTNPHLVANDNHIGVVDLKADEDLTTDPAAMRKLGKAFTDLRKHADGLLIAEKILRRDVPRMIARANGRDFDEELGRAA